MKKNDLIEILKNIEGNPDILLWNGFVEDYTDIKGLVEDILVKETPSHFEYCLNAEWVRDNSTFDVPQKVKDSHQKIAQARYKESEWEFPNEFVTKDEFDKWYGNNIKQVFLVEPKERGKSSWDRMGDMYY